MITQSFLYNAIFFTYALVLTKFLPRPVQENRPTTSCVLSSGTCSAR